MLLVLPDLYIISYFTGLFFWVLALKKTKKRRKQSDKQTMKMFEDHCSNYTIKFDWPAIIFGFIL